MVDAFESENCFIASRNVSVITAWSFAIKISFLAPFWHLFVDPELPDIFAAGTFSFWQEVDGAWEQILGRWCSRMQGLVWQVVTWRGCRRLWCPDYVAFIPTWELGEGWGGSIENLDLFKCAAHCDKGVVGLSRFFLLRRAGGESPALVRWGIQPLTVDRRHRNHLDFWEQEI